MSASDYERQIHQHGEDAAFDSIAPTPYQRLEAIVHEYAYGFDLDEYEPSDQERDVVKQAINGLICREDFMEVILQARALTHADRKAEGQHICCGAGLDHPHYAQCVNARGEG